VEIFRYPNGKKRFLRDDVAWRETDCPNRWSKIYSPGFNARKQSTNLLRRPLDPLHRKFKTERLGLEDLIRLTPNRQNLQCRFIAGVGRVEDLEVSAEGGRAISLGISDERLLEIAKENLTHSFRVVGLTERFQESLALMMASFGWRVSFYENRRVTKIRPAVEPRMVDMIRGHNRLDIELYEFAKKLFEEDLRTNEDSVREALDGARHSRESFCGGNRRRLD